jgi:predicted site-specific integrase-resolvase
MNYPPPWMDTAALAAHVSISVSTIEAWVAQGILPPPRKRGGKLMWKWSEVDERLMNGESSPDAEAQRIRDATRKAAQENRSAY